VLHSFALILWHIQQCRFSLRINKWAASWHNQHWHNQHNWFATSMDLDQPELPRSLIRIHAVSLPTLLQVEKLIANSMDPDHVRLRGCAGWSWSTLVANALCWYSWKLNRYDDFNPELLYILRRVRIDFEHLASSYFPLFYKNSQMFNRNLSSITICVITNL
jgi:hypothetical protein